MPPKVSICIPTYNRKDYLKETLESVFAQTYKDYEVVIVDDGSTDGTGEMIKNSSYNVRYYWQENAGDASARNKLVELAQAEFITFIDSDDLLMPGAIEIMMKVVEAENEDVIAYGSYLRINQKGNVYGRCRQKLYSGYITKYLFQNILVHSCGSMFPIKVFQEVGGFDESLPVCSDYDFWLRISLKYRFIALHKPTFKRRRHSENLSCCSLANRLTELNVLRRFYFEKGGDKVVPSKVAARRLSKESYRVGKCAIKEKKYGLACSLLREAFYHHPNPKCLIMWGFASVKYRRLS